MSHQDNIPAGDSSPGDIALETFKDLRYGHFLDELGEKVKMVTAKVGKTRKVGSVTIKLTFKITGREGEVEIFDDIKAKEPDITRPGTVMFHTEEGELSRDNPRQAELFPKGQQLRKAAQAEQEQVWRDAGQGAPAQVVKLVPGESAEIRTIPAVPAPVSVAAQ